MKGSGRSLAWNIALLTVSPLLRAAVALPLAGFVAHSLGVDGYGRFNFALSFAVLFSVIANIGLNETFLRRAATDPPDLPRLWSSVLAGKVLLVAGYVTILGILATGLGHDSGLVWLILVMAAYQGIQSLENTSVAVFSARQDMKVVAGIGAAKVFAEVAVTVLVLLAGAQAFGLAVSRMALGAVAMLAAAVAVRRWVRLPLVRPSAAGVRPLVAPGLSFATIAAVACINDRAGVLVLERMHGLGAVAMFSAAMMLTERVSLFLPAIQNALFPFFSAMGREEEHRFASSLARAIHYQCLLAIGLGLGVSLVGPWALRLVFPRSFDAVGPVLEVMGIAVAVRTLNGLLTTALLARGRERAIVRVSVLQCVVNVGSALVLVGRFGAAGLAWALGISEGVVLLSLIALLRRRGTLDAPQLTRLAVPAVCGLALFAAFTAVPNGRDSLVMPLAFAAAYVPLLVAARALSREDIGYFAAVLVRRARQQP
jgi:O-antigen/teichoic acid export membrane protein